ncbi:hypothetical protein BGZ57DRAFT_200234 [Hyaloscypha finlandica]|nr:hypothetical protein BGZ57DRAFT_200234 [Hyaloscypha finlandica]
MAAAWPQGAQPSTPNNGPQYPPSTPLPQRKNTNPPPICYKCEGEHFVKDCPQGSLPIAGPFPQPPTQAYQQYPRPAPPVQAYPPQPGPPQQYTAYPQNQQYGASGPQTAYSQPPQQQYSVPPVAQYGRPGYQASPYSQYPQPNGPPQYGGPGYQPPPQQYHPPAAAPYQPPNPYTQPPAGYGGPQPGPPAAYQAPPPQWNLPPTARPPYQQIRRSASFQQQELSATPSQQSQPQLQLDYGQEAPKQTPQTPVSNHGSLQHGAPQVAQSSPATAAAESKVASAASTPRNQQAPSMGFVRKESTHSLVSEGQASESKYSEGKEGDDPFRVESETPTPEDEDAQFDWDFRYIFKEPERKETVALAQPLSAIFLPNSTPVPLVQAWSIHIPSISRYARKDNGKEFVRSIRNAPQWSFLQEDPGFSDEPLEGPLIPLSEVPAWTVARHRTPTELVTELENDECPESRKRPRSEEQEEGQIDEQDDVDNRIALESSEIEAEGPRAKRQKNEEDEGQLDEVMGTPTVGTPVLTNGRAGTPCLQTDDDAWAPEEGERAASPVDPTEALLASLGVSGTPKPVKQESLPPYPAPNEENESPQTPTPAGSQQNQQTPTVPPPNVAQSTGQPMSNAYGNTPQGNPQWISPANTPQVKPQWNAPPSAPQSQPQWGPSTNAPYGGGQAAGPPGPPANAPYGNGPPTGPPGPPANQPYVNNQYGPPINAPYGNGLPPYAVPMNQQYGPPVNAPYGPPNGYQPGPSQPYGPPQAPSYGNAPPYNAPQPYPQQYGPPTNFQQGPPQYAQPSAPYGPPSNFPQGTPQYPPPQRAPSLGNGPPVPGPYGGPPQTSPVQYGPPQNVPYNAYPNPLQQYSSNGPQPNLPYPNGPPVQPPYGNIPPRQDSGYVSARGSYSNGSGPPEYLQQNATQNSAPPVPQNDPNRLAQVFDGLPNQNQKEINLPQQLDRRNGGEEGSADTINSNGTDSAEDGGTPLSPTSAEILGKLVRKNSTGDGSRQKSEASRKIKRPQPVVADAYSRRW